MSNISLCCQVNPSWICMSCGDRQCHECFNKTVWEDGKRPINDSICIITNRRVYSRHDGRTNVWFEERQL